MCRKTGIAYSTFNKWLGGIEPSMDQQQIVAETLGATVAEMLVDGGEEAWEIRETMNAMLSAMTVDEARSMLEVMTAIRRHADVARSAKGKG